MPRGSQTTARTGLSFHTPPLQRYFVHLCKMSFLVSLFCYGSGRFGAVSHDLNSVVHGPLAVSRVVFDQRFFVVFGAACCAAVANKILTRLSAQGAADL